MKFLYNFCVFLREMRNRCDRESKVKSEKKIAELRKAENETETEQRKKKQAIETYSLEIHDSKERTEGGRETASEELSEHVDCLNARNLTFVCSRISTSSVFFFVRCLFRRFSCVSLWPTRAF